MKRHEREKIQPRKENYFLFVVFQRAETAVGAVRVIRLKGLVGRLISHDLSHLQAVTGLSIAFYNQKKSAWEWRKGAEIVENGRTTKSFR